MTKFIILTMSILSLTAHSFALETVPQLDLESYKGLWHEIGSIPQSFSKDCVANTTAEYNILEDGLVQVLNSCYEADGNINVAEGRARLDRELNSPSKLEVTFVKFIDWVWSFSGAYWVIDLDEAYQWSVVGHPDLTYLWILSRTPSMNLEKLYEIRRDIEAMGYDACQVLMTKNDSNTYNGQERLCDL